MKYLLGTGRYKVDAHWEALWMHHNIKGANPKPSGLMKLEVGVDEWRVLDNNRISIGANLGHVGDLLNGTKPHQFCGWSAGAIALAMLAYNSELDFVYLEQDALAFGPWVEQMYADMGDGNMVFGGQMKSAPYMPSAQSLFLIRHSFIPHFVWRYLGMGPDGDVNNLPETKFARMLANEPHHFRALSFGVDRERPLPYDAKVFYGQKFTQKELDELKRRKLI